MSNSLNFNTGEVFLSINGDETKQIHFNPHDLGFIVRFDNASKEAEKMSKKYFELQKQAKVVDEKKNNSAMALKIAKESDKEARKIINDLMGYECDYLIFGNVNPLSKTSKGKSILQNFIEALSLYMQKENEKDLESDKDKIDEYKEAYDRIPS